MISTNILPCRRLSLFVIKALLFPVVFLALLFQSCVKDELKNTDVSPDARYDMYHKLKSFMEKSEGKEPGRPALLPRTGYDEEDIIDYVEGTLNLVYADPSLSWAGNERTYDTFAIVLTSGYAGEEDVIALFEQARDSASHFFYDLEEEDKFPKLYDVVNLYSSASLLEISVMTMVGTVHRDLTPFGPYDYWDIFENGNTCDPEDDYENAPNASSKMSDALNLYFLPYYCHFFTDVTLVSSQQDILDPSLVDVGWRQDNQTETAGDWIVDFRTLKTVCNSATSECLEFVENGVYCLAPEEMNYYFNSIRIIYQDFGYAHGWHLMESVIGLVPLAAGSLEIKTWESDDCFGELHDCDDGDEYPFALPPCIEC